MLTVKATNIKQYMNNKADYAVEVFTSREVLFFGTIKNHDRFKGWTELLRQIADAGEKERK